MSKTKTTILPLDEDSKHIVFSVTMPRGLIKEIDRRRGYMPRSAWLKTLAVKEITRLNGVPAHTASRTEGSSFSEIYSPSKGDDSSHG